MYKNKIQQSVRWLVNKCPYQQYSWLKGYRLFHCLGTGHVHWNAVRDTSANDTACIEAAKEAARMQYPFSRQTVDTFTVPLYSWISFLYMMISQRNKHTPFHPPWLRVCATALTWDSRMGANLKLS